MVNPNLKRYNGVDNMKISDFMEIVVVDKNGMHKMNTTEDIEEYLENDNE